MSTKKQITETLLTMAGLPNAPDFQQSAGQIVDSYLDILEDLEENALRVAALHYRSRQTFFPTPGDLRKTAIELYFMAGGIPSPIEAWGQVLNARQYVAPKFCDECSRLAHCMDEAQRIHDDAAYRANHKLYSDHLDSCLICNKGGFREVYGHAVVAETVRLMGGREALFTENPTADRARFADDYKVIVEREKTKATLLPAVKEYVAEKRAQLDAGNKMADLAGRLGNGQ